MSVRRMQVGLTLAAVVVAAACAESDRDPLQPDPDGLRFVITSFATGEGELYLVDPAREEFEALTSHPGFDGYPQFHPDGQTLVFTSERSNGDQEIYRMDRDGSNPMRLTEHEGADWGARFSPDGSQIVFARMLDRSNSEIFIMNADGSGETRLTDHEFEDDFPVFSPDGQKIYFRSSRDGALKIMRMDLDGSNLETILGDGELLWTFAVDPATGRLVYSRGDPVEPPTPVILFLWEAEADGSGAQPLNGVPFRGTDPSFSPDGDVMVFTLSEGGGAYANVLALDVATGEIDRITNTPVVDRWAVVDPLSGR